ncbi:MAG: glucosamine-6-phosphate deaminase [Firmicutes bacterium]|nr:glucosamine-6-phosphate deaminase [Bacillota bacterium]
MNVIKARDYTDLSKKAAVIIAAQMIRKPGSVLGFATGSTPEGTYRELADLNAAGVIDFSEITTFNLDEYFGLPGTHPQSYLYFMKDKLFNHVNMRPEAIHVPDGVAENPAASCAAYEQGIREAGGIDLQLLGIGRNGHIGFNEPDTAFADETHVVTLTESTKIANSRLFGPGEQVPDQAVTMGIGTIMRARSILLIANGSEKQEILDQALNGPVTPEIPASALQYHKRVTVIYCD